MSLSSSEAVMRGWRSGAIWNHQYETDQHPDLPEASHLGYDMNGRGRIGEGGATLSTSLMVEKYGELGVRSIFACLGRGPLCYVW